MKRIRIGNQTAYFATPTLLPFEFAVENNFDTFEWFPDKKESGEGFNSDEIDIYTRTHIRKTAYEKDIALSVHAPWWANPMKPDEQHLIMDEIIFAQDLGAILLNIHLYKEDGIESYLNAITPIIKKTSEARLKLSIENTTLTTPEDFNTLFTLIRNHDKIKSSNVGMCLDLGHANLCDSTRNDYLKYIDKLDSHVPIIHIHLHENYGDIDSHLPIFTGPSEHNDEGVLGFIKRLKRRNFNGSIIFEQWTDSPSILSDTRNRLIRLFNETNLTE